MKKVKFLALLACLVFALSLFTMACTQTTPSSEEESNVTSEQVSEPTSDPESDPESEIESEPASELESESESESESEVESESESEVEPVLLSATFMVDGEVFETCYFTAELPEILEPEVPAKDGYTARWEDYTLGTESITVNAIYEAIEYTITFVGYEADPIVFTVETMADVVFPTLPTEDGYDIYWDKTEADITLSDMTVNYVREIAKYTVTFVGVDGIDPIVYTADEMANVVFPEAPALAGYEVSWDKSEADLTLADLTVNYVKVAIEYTITFVGVDGFEPIVFTVETLADVVIPDAPAVDGYMTGWDKSIEDVTLADIEFTYYKMTEEEFYLRDVEGEAMASIFVPLSANNSVEWDATEKTYHFVNRPENVDNDRALTLDATYIAKWAELGVVSFAFDIRFDTDGVGETLYMGFYPDWWTANWNFDIWQLTGTDWRRIVIHMEDIPMTNDGALKTLFLLGDQGSGILIKNFEVLRPDFANFSDRDLANAFRIHPYAPANRVEYDEQEGAVLFTNNVADQDNKRGFWMSSALTDALTAKAEAITFQVKATVNASIYIIATTKDPNDGWFSWGANSPVGCAAGEWISVRFPVNADIERLALLIDTVGGFYIKDVALVFPEVIPEIDELTNESLAKMFIPTAGGSSVAWDETEGAFRFTVDSTAAKNGDNSRSIIINPKFMAKLRAVTNTISFKVKFLSDVNPSGINDQTLYVSYAADGMDGNWWGRHQGVGWQADTWVTVTTVFNADTSLTLFLLNGTGTFLVKDFEIPQPDTVTPVHEYEVTPIAGVVTGLGLNTVEQMPFVDNAPEGVNGTAISLAYTAQYAGFAVSFPEYTGSEGVALSIRVYAQSSAPTFDMWFYNIAYAEPAGDHSDYKATNVATNQWVDIIIDISNLPAFVNSEGKFVGFQAGLFAGGISAFYIDSIAVVNVTPTPNVPLVG